MIGIFYSIKFIDSFQFHQLYKEEKENSVNKLHV
jgi:hypothetical protein